MRHDFNVRRPEPSWAATLFVIVAIVGYCLYTAARFRGAVRVNTEAIPALSTSGADGADASDAQRR